MSDDLHSLSGAYVLDALTDEERTDFEVHVQRCDTCRDEISSLREVTPLLAESVAVEPPADLRAAVLRQARETRQDPPPVAGGDSGHGSAPETESATVLPLRRRGTWVGLAAAASLVFGGGVAWQAIDREPTSVTQQVAQAEDAQTWRAETADGAKMSVTRSEELDKAVLTIKGLDDPGDGRTYQAWLMDDQGKLAPAGLASGDGELVLSGDTSKAKGVGVSVEPKGGSTQPTTDPIGLVKLA